MGQGVTPRPVSASHADDHPVRATMCAYLGAGFCPASVDGYCISDNLEGECAG